MNSTVIYLDACIMDVDDLFISFTKINVSLMEGDDKTYTICSLG